MSATKYKKPGQSKSVMAESKWNLPAAWRNGELTPDGIARCYHHLLPEVQELESNLGSVENAVKGYLDAVGAYCKAGSLLSTTFSKLLHGTLLSKISQQYQQATEQLDHSLAHQTTVDITNCVMATLSDFAATLPGIKQEIERYKRCKVHYEKCSEGLESFAQKDSATSEPGKRFYLAKERFHTADNEFQLQGEQLRQCLSSLEGNRIKMLGAGLLSLLQTSAQFCSTSSTKLTPLGQYQSVGDYLRDSEIAPQLKEATVSWCAIAQSHQSVRDSEYLSGEEIYKLLEHKKGHELPSMEKDELSRHLKVLLENYKKDVEDIEDDHPVVIPGGFSKNPAGIGLALKGCCSRLETLAISGNKEPASHEEMIASLRCETPKVQLAVGSVGKPWCKISSLKDLDSDSDEVLSRQHCIRDLVGPLAKQFDIPFTKESLQSFTLTVLNEACSEKTILASKTAVQLMYGKTDLVLVRLSPESMESRLVRVNCKETSVNIEVLLTWWVTSDQTLFSGILDEENEPLLQVDTTYSTMIDYMDYLEEKQPSLPSITVELNQCNKTQDGLENGTFQCQTVCSACHDHCPVAPPRKKHYARKVAVRKKETEINSEISRTIASMDEKKRAESSRKEKDKDWFSLSSKLPSLEPSFTSTTSQLSLASESELSEVINFLSGSRHRITPDAEDADTESLYSIKAMSDSGIDSVKNANLGRKSNNGAVDPVEGQTKGKKGKKKEKKGASKTESFSKKKKKKRGDKAKKEKKKAANSTVDEQKEVGASDIKEEKIESNDNNDGGTLKREVKEAGLSSQSKVSVATGCSDDSNVHNPETSSQNTVILSNSLRSVWEQSEKDVNQQDAIASSKLSQQAAADLGMQSVATYGSQDSLYHSRWSLRGVAGDADDANQLVDRSNPTDVSSQLNLGHCWVNGYERDPAPKRNIWSPSTPKIENNSKNDSWPPSLTRQNGIDLGEIKQQQQHPPVVGESVFSLGLENTGFELVAAAKQAGVASSQSNDGRNEKCSSLNEQRMTSSQPSMWTHGRPTAGQFVEKSSSYGEGLHRPRILSQKCLPLQSYHSDPFLAKEASSWPLQPPPMYMKRQYSSGIITPYGAAGVSQQMRARVRLNHQSLPTMKRRETLPARFYPHSDRSGAGPL